MKKKIIVSVCAVVILSVLLTVCTELVRLKYTEEKYYEGRLCGEYYAEAGGHDVLFIGDCEVYESFVPAVMWDEYGISSYVRGTPQQLAWQSYYLLEEMFKYETPKVVVFNVLALKYGEPQDEARNWMTISGMKWSTSKIGAIISSMTEEESFLDYIFPLLRFHSRITELTGDDFKYAYRELDAVSHSGYLMKTDINPMPEALIGEEGTPLYDYTLPSEAMDYLDRMRDLCEEKGSELVLVKAPTNSVTYWWYDEWDERIVDYAEKNGLSYYNLVPLADEIGIDWSVDTYDAGVHLNVTGAEKTSRYFAEILLRHGVTDRREDTELAQQWEARVDRYYNERNEDNNNEE